MCNEEAWLGRRVNTAAPASNRFPGIGRIKLLFAEILS